MREARKTPDLPGYGPYSTPDEEAEIRERRREREEAEYERWEERWKDERK